MNKPSRLLWADFKLKLHITAETATVEKYDLIYEPSNISHDVSTNGIVSLFLSVVLLENMLENLSEVVLAVSKGPMKSVLVPNKTTT